MILEHVIFSVSPDVHLRAKFYRHMDTLRVMGKLVGTMSIGTGKYNGQYEECYMLPARDFDKHLRGSYLMEGQESTLRVPGDTRQPCTLEFTDGTHESLGPMKHLGNEEPKGLDSWTYIHGNYWAC